MQSAIRQGDAKLEAGPALVSAQKSTPIVPGAPLGRIGNLEVRLARNDAEIAAAQEIRYRVFYDELGAGKGRLHLLDQRDIDHFDPLCDHLLVFDSSLPGPEHRALTGAGLKTLRPLRGRATPES